MAEPVGADPDDHAVSESPDRLSGAQTEVDAHVGSPGEVPVASERVDVTGVAGGGRLVELERDRSLERVRRELDDAVTNVTDLPAVEVGGPG